MNRDMSDARYTAAAAQSCTDPVSGHAVSSRPAKSIAPDASPRPSSPGVGTMSGAMQLIRILLDASSMASEKVRFVTAAFIAE